MQYWNLLLHDNNGDTVRTSKAKESFLCIVVPNWIIIFSVHLLLQCGYICRNKLLGAEKRDQYIKAFGTPDSYPYHKCLENFTTDWILSGSPHNKCSHLIFVLKLSEEQNIATDPPNIAGSRLCTLGTELHPLEGICLL